MKKNYLILAALIMMLPLILPAQNTEVAGTEAPREEKKPWIHVGADFVSRYVWRGTAYGKAPAIQPTLVFDPQIGLKLGAWGNYSITGDYAEADLFLSYTFKGASVVFTDYFFPNENIPMNKYFNYKNATTGHQFELGVGYDGPEKVPIHFFAGTILYGADKKLDKMIIDTLAQDTTYSYKNRYSTYIELGYTIKNFSLNVGFTPMAGVYGTSAGIVNVSLTGRKTFVITDKFNLPTYASLVFNPQSQNIYLVFGLTL